ncbi:sugar phosphate isomerase/epimerase [Arthrobacter sp. zg-ZUI100]|uniref:Sugar phosphate isomerase/epimerase n=1 Tax=Arthrobacter jiangjiafuii TaxID=2817475 RepID=A0A975R0N4_9MICC|nr:sugar phosphate isomerase/epimerase [Arthrobacter jiangjiafuii]MBP3035258.1 sugar phosphate isomerase/epimerase [Arthrobacter jiangjiafuii]MBP3042556.1 sugar phosphate isomerase/epimerase [Arthrobacter jiangjiafuii]QWC09708.1 sugar phosphate isomerase/epimerase [Arthrobacter jiangjiafuii]
MSTSPKISVPEDTSAAAIPVALSSASVYPLSVHDTFAIAHDLGYDGVEIMVTGNADSQNPQTLNALSERYGQPIMAIHAPTLLLTQQVWGKAWTKIELSAAMAAEVGATTVVAHPPFRWQSGYAENFAEGVRHIAEQYGVIIAVENMYPWRVRGREAKAYLPHWNPVTEPYEHVTWDFSHAAIAGMDSYEELLKLGPRLHHVHLTDGTPNGRDEHMLPGEGTQRCAEALQYLSETGFSGVVAIEVSTRKVKGAGEREDQLKQTLEFARMNLGQISE